MLLFIVYSNILFNTSAGVTAFSHDVSIAFAITLIDDVTLS